MDIKIITHRGLEPSAENFSSESSYEAFCNHLKRGYGIEFDINLSRDGQIPIFHDAGLQRITNGQDKRLFADMDSKEIKTARLGKGDRLCFFDELLDMIASGNQDSISALHLKGGFQELAFLNILVSYLKNAEKTLRRIIVFDTKIETAKYLKSKLPELNLAPSVAHPYDIQRYNQAVKGTLLSIKEVLVNKDLFFWVWLDEWDLTGENSGAKKFYTAETFGALKNNGLKIALVTPELHGASPGLLGGEFHPDANKERLFVRIKEIVSLKPDALCTDYPKEVKNII